MFTQLFSDDPEDGEGLQVASSGAKSRAQSAMASTQQQGNAAMASASTSSYGQRARNLFQGGQAQAASSPYGSQAQSMFATTRAQATEQAKGALSSATQAGNQGLKSMYNQLPVTAKERMDGAAIKAAGFGSVGAMLSKRKMEAFDLMFVMSSPVLTQIMFGLRETVKDGATADPDMPEWVANRVESVVDSFWDDLLIYMEKIKDDSKTYGLNARDYDQLADAGVHPMPMTPFWIRARTLYHYAPFDKSIFGNLKDPVWLGFTLVSVLPIFGLRTIWFFTILGMLLRGCPADEYQLVNYILTLKGSQVLVAIFLSMVSTVKYYACVHSDLAHSCDTDGPGASADVASGITDFVGSCILVWVAFLSLPCSRSSAGSRQVGAEDDDDDDDNLTDGSVGTATDSDGNVGGRSRFRRWCRCCSRWDSNRGGRLFGLLFWDLLSFILSCVMLALLCDIDISHARVGGRPTDMSKWQNIFSWNGDKNAIATDLNSWEFKETFFLIRIIYGLLMFPYLIFVVPMLNGILTHTTPTGFNKQGMCVPFMLPRIPAKKGH
mmetsp:Transcript_44419/g.142370  ORF Transcript_44419/g.142370 Transcript_44419/m.142370 type:complete len:550 (+) Transcript_44419:97-1746(+)